jgi:hypothetical protein
VRVALQLAAAAVAGAAIWAALNGASPFWTLAAGIAVGGLLVTSRRGRGDR